MVRIAPAQSDPQETWRRAITIVSIVLVFGFVLLMVVLGQSLAAATGAAAACAFAAANLAHRLASPSSRRQQPLNPGAEPKGEDDAQT
ncbi:hypothetical protein ACFQS3_05690 [Glycomyces mayteni]|uniref:Uncharacterized protein n=1 Tax=Glycomyces mayteni TaxID=543887 RepID=A0ABW2D320_9ACTN|nr:hypothetical protein GCM10025732_55480 [Glycomyces mayteni]